MGEDRLIAWLRRQISRQGRDALGDDAAFLERQSWAVSVDQQITGTHFDAGLGPAVVARRLLAVNLSDLAATGADPVYGLLTAAVPPGYRLKTFFRAFLAAARKVGLTLAGGDLAHSELPVFTLTVFGRRVPGGRWLTRGAGRPGDRLWVGGTLGESAAGRLLLERGADLSGSHVRLPPELAASESAAAARRAVRRHLQPRPQLELGRWLARRRRAAVIDVSDGLLLDLERLCRASGVGAEIDARRAPRPPGLDELVRELGRDPLQLAASGGEDYVLLAALPPSVEPPTELGCSPIGELKKGEAVRVLGLDRPPRWSGWDHLSRGGR